MEDEKFDDLAKRVARPISRRQVVKTLVATTIGGLFIRSGTGEAFADNSSCAHFCNATFPPGPDRGRCKSDGAHGQGLCATPCATSPPGGTVCAAAQGYANTTCCVSGQNCVNGTCAGVCTGPSLDACSFGAACSGQAAVCGGCGCYSTVSGGTSCFTNCACPAQCVCATGQTCVNAVTGVCTCATSADCFGGGVCTDGQCVTCTVGGTDCPNGMSCVTDSLGIPACVCTGDTQCPAGQACISDYCCGGVNTCQPFCAAGAASGVSLVATSMSGTNRGGGR